MTNIGSHGKTTTDGLINQLAIPPSFVTASAHQVP
jgi:UDP-N-acetylmuramate-alanine ligase